MEESGSRRVKTITKDIDVTSQDLLSNNNQKPITLKDMLGESEYDIVNPEMVIFTVVKPMKKRIKLKIGVGRGYIPAEEQQLPNKEVNDMYIDALFSPVRMVNHLSKIVVLVAKRIWIA